jgi:hypothetical protein
MDELIKNVTSIAWWIGVVLVGIVLNLVSAYLQPRLDRFLSFVSSTWRLRSEKKREQWQRRLAEVRQSPDEQLFVLAEEMRCRLRAMFYFAVALLLLVFSFWIQTLTVAYLALGEKMPYGWFGKINHVASLIMVFVSFFEWSSAERHRALIAEVRRRETS